MAKTDSRLKFPFDDQLWGYERHRFSDEFGKLVVKTIRLWTSPKQKKHAHTLPHASEISVLRRRRGPGGRWFYQVQSKEDPEIRGWVWKPWLRKQGAIE